MTAQETYTMMVERFYEVIRGRALSTCAAICSTFSKVMRDPSWVWTHSLATSLPFLKATSGPCSRVEDSDRHSSPAGMEQLLGVDPRDCMILWRNSWALDASGKEKISSVTTWLWETPNNNQ